VSAKARPFRNEDLASGPFQHAVQLARKHGVGVAAFERARRTADELGEQFASLPGGATVQAEAVRRLRASICEKESGIARLLGEGWAPEGKAISDGKAELAAMKVSLAAQEAVLASLPAEALTDPREALHRAQEKLDQARQSRDRDAIQKAARVVTDLQAAQLDARQKREAVLAEIRKATEQARSALIGALRGAIELVAISMGELTGDAAFLSAPELVDIVAVERKWKDALDLAEAIGYLAGAPPNTMKVLAAMPKPVLLEIGPRLGFSRLRLEEAFRPVAAAEVSA
jgi:hypothetical protein